MLGEAEQRQVPADAHRTGTEHVPEAEEGGVLMRDMLELKPGASDARRLQRDDHPADAAATFPADREPPRRITFLDGAGRIALQLVATAEAQFARDRHEPSADALGLGDRAPNIVDVAVIATLRHNRACQ